VNETKSGDPQGRMDGAGDLWYISLSVACIPPTQELTMTLPTDRPAPATPPPLRLRRANRDQVAPVPAYLDALLPADHLARLVWAAVERLDLREFTAPLKVVEGGPGRAAADPAVLVALWLYATSQGVSSARALARLCVEHLAYIWLCGGVSINYHTLSDFRVQHAAALDALMTQALGCLHQAGLVDFDHVAQDGIRVRASAGAASFHRQTTLEHSLAEAQRVVKTSAASPADEAAAPTPREQAARQRAARERVARLEAALAALPPRPPPPTPGAPAGPAGEVVAPPPAAPPQRARRTARASKKAAKVKEPRTSSTDASAQVMKMADGGFRPAYNIQFAADTGAQVVVGVAVSSCGSDMNQAPPMVRQVAARLDALPTAWLMDGGFASTATIEALDQAGVVALAPVQTPKDPGRDRYAARPGDSAAVAAWRERMGTAAAQTLYKVRAATIECVNAQARMRHGLQQLRVRGVAKVRCVATWVALTHNLLIWLRHGLAGGGGVHAA
jgi:transposase